MQEMVLSPFVYLCLLCLPLSTIVPIVPVCPHRQIFVYHSSTRSQAHPVPSTIVDTWRYNMTSNARMPDRHVTRFNNVTLKFLVATPAVGPLIVQGTD